MKRRCAVGYCRRWVDADSGCAARVVRPVVALVTGRREPVTKTGDVDQARSKRSRFMTLSHAATKSRTNFSFESSHA
jgi:hypothetical protein